MFSSGNEPMVCGHNHGVLNGHGACPCSYRWTSLLVMIHGHTLFRQKITASMIHRTSTARQSLFKLLGLKQLTVLSVYRHLSGLKRFKISSLFWRQRCFVPPTSLFQDTLSSLSLIKPVYCIYDASLLHQFVR